MSKLIADTCKKNYVFSTPKGGQRLSVLCDTEYINTSHAWPQFKKCLKLVMNLVMKMKAMPKYEEIQLELTWVGEDASG